jgi:hypothetical protein
MNDRRIAEWLSVDDALDEAEDDLEIDPGRQVPAEAPARRRARPATIQRRRSAAFGAGLEGQQARVLELIAAVVRRIRRRPLVALAVGVGMGFAIGGALSFRAGRLLLAAGARRAARELLKQLV